MQVNMRVSLYSLKFITSELVFARMKVLVDWLL